MDNKYRLLILDDKAEEAELILREIEKDPAEFVTAIAASKSIFKKTLKSYCPDVILFDYNIAGYDGISALADAQAQCPQAVKICVSGTIGEEYAAQIMKMGADDFVLKRHSAKLMPAIKAAIQEKKPVKAVIDNGKINPRETGSAKTEFLSIMNHELRTPLNAVIGFSEILQDKIYGELNAKQSEYVGFILAGGRHLLSMMNDLLDLSKIEDGKLELNFEKVNVYSTAKNVCRMFEGLAAKNSVSIVFDDATDKDAGITADLNRLKQVFFNIVGNAVKFSKPGGIVTLKICALDDCVEVCVKDTGVGMKDKELQTILKSFSRIEDDAYSKEIGGAGYGLALTRKIVGLHSGKLNAQSEHGKGSVFTLTMPLKQKEK